MSLSRQRPVAVADDEKQPTPVPGVRPRQFSGSDSCESMFAAAVEPILRPPRAEYGTKGRGAAVRIAPGVPNVRKGSGPDTYPSRGAKTRSPGDSLADRQQHQTGITLGRPINDLVGAGEDYGWDLDAERSRGIEIDG